LSSGVGFIWLIYPYSALFLNPKVKRISNGRRRIPLL
jgi:hypothetical protein